MCAKKVNTLHLEPVAERLLAVACGDGSVALWDVRQLGPKAKPVATAVHTNTCQSAFFAPDGAPPRPSSPPHPPVSVPPVPFALGVSTACFCASRHQAKNPRQSCAPDG